MAGGDKLDANQKVVVHRSIGLRFFTLEWWQGLQDDGAPYPFVTYRECFDRIQKKLPVSFAEFCKRVSLHDSRLRGLRLNAVNQELQMELTGDDGQGGLRRFALVYGGVVTFESNADPNNGLAGPHGYGDWGYDEADMLDGGLCEHRILFSSGIEVRVRSLTSGATSGMTSTARRQRKSPPRSVCPGSIVRRKTQYQVEPCWANERNRMTIYCPLDDLPLAAIRGLGNGRQFFVEKADGTITSYRYVWARFHDSNQPSSRSRLESHLLVLFPMLKALPKTRGLH